MYLFVNMYITYFLNRTGVCESARTHMCMRFPTPRNANSI